MLDKDKLYIVTYLGLKGISDADVPAHIEDVTKHLSEGFDDSVKFLVIPTKNKDTHIEFFNGEMLKNLEPDDVKSLIEKLQSWEV
jgi:hypothetical protein